MSIMDLGKLKRIKRVELYEIILAQDEEIKRLRQETADLSVKLAKRDINIQKAGTLAEAAFSLTNIFEEAQKVADIYLENVKMQTSNEKKKKKD